MQLHTLDLIVVGLYFASLLGVGYYIMKQAQKGKENESFLAADRNMGLIRTTGSAAATDLGVQLHVFPSFSSASFRLS